MVFAFKLQGCNQCQQQFSLIWKAGYTRQTTVYQKMDSLKIHDSELINRERPSMVNSFLNSKVQKASFSTEENSNHESTKLRPRRILPDYKFKITNYFIGDNVEYEVELTQSFKVFRKTISEVYKFKTRYSKLQALNQKVGGQNFPAKKIFGNKNKEFVQRRKGELEIYLNGLCTQKCPEFLNFILQIKQLNLEANCKRHFKLPL